MIKTVKDILDFWFSAENEPKWFEKDGRFDAEIKNKFFDTHQLVHSKGDWSLEKTPAGGLAQIILLDQFPRNMFRDSPLAFASDRVALAIADQAIELGFEKNMSKKELHFLYLPFMHSENLAHQEYCLNKFREFAGEISIDFARRHKDIIKQFGRFPHRNKILGRESTKEELEFLKQPNSSF